MLLQDTRVFNPKIMRVFISHIQKSTRMTRNTNETRFSQRVVMSTTEAIDLEDTKEYEDEKMETIMTETSIKQSVVRKPRRPNKRILEPTERKEIEEIFQLFDTDGSGTMDAGEIRIVLWALGFQPEGDDVERMITEFFDISFEQGDEVSLNLNEFLLLMTDKISERDSHEQLMTAFNLFDIEQKGVILLKDIKRAAKEIDLPFKDNELELIMNTIDKDGGGEVTADEWIRVMRTRNK